MESQNREAPWYKQWFDENYLLLYRHRDLDDAREQFRLILDVLKPDKKNTVLDLACGEGRYASFFDKSGYRVLGLDLSETLIRRGKEKYPDLGLVVGDMRSIPGKFDLILSLFTSFGYFEEDRENRLVLDAVYAALNENGIFWLDFLNSTYVRHHLVPDNFSQISTDIHVREKRKIAGSRIIKDIYFKGNGTTTHYRESVRLYTRWELEEMLQEAGFSLEGCFGDYRGEAWSEDCRRTILYGRKSS